MKKFLRILALALALVSVLASLCACGSAIDRAVKNADEVIEAKKQGTQKNEYSSELIYYEDKDFYEYVISVEIGQSTDNPDTLTYNLQLNIKGYFDDFENLDVVVRYYISGVAYREYRNWKLVD